MIEVIIMKLLHKIKCIFGFHEASKFVTYEIYGKKFHVCKWCDKLIDDIER